MSKKKKFVGPVKRVKTAVKTVGTVGAVAACATVMTVSTAVTAVGAADLMLSVIMGRRNAVTDKISSLAVKGCMPDITRSIEAGKRVGELPIERMTIVSPDNLTLVGHWYPAENPVRTLILIHGWHGDWKTDLGVSVPFYHDVGCNVLMIEQRAHGESEGKYLTFGIKERYDVELWVNAALEKAPGLPLYVGGVSMGAATALMTAGLSLGDKVTGVVSDCAFTSPYEIVKKMLKPVTHVLTDAALAGIQAGLRVKEGITLKDTTTIDAMQADTDIPVLFIHGDADKFVPVEMTLENYVACRAPKELMIVKGAGHAFSYYVDTEGYQKRLLGFFETYDGRLNA